MFLQTMQETHRLHVAAGEGAGIVLVSGCGEYKATFDCARRCAEVLGNRGLSFSYLEAPVYKIALPDMREALEKLSARYSVALVDYCQDRHGSRFVLVWRIAALGATFAKELSPTPKEITLDDI